MPSSKSLLEFLDSLAMAEELVVAERPLPDPPSGATEALGLALRGGAAILMVSSFEAFLHALFLERLGSLTQQPPVIAFSKLPDRMRLKSVWESLGLAMRGPRGSKTERVDRLAEVIYAARVVGAEIVSPGAFAETKANPGPGTVQEMYADVGVADIFTVVRGGFDALWGRPEASSFLKDKLEEIVGRRNAVAHAVDVRRITRDQLDEAILFLKALATVLDARLESQVNDLLRTCAP
ncbi:HEPN domain-containing protein [Actinotalea fermentans]|uniref:RiboL-PSP-HEPN domain-containing protein n=1 Tax=Actinotalea fermentans TaxID=43671 RepID=A0A511YXF6_9CELL|nr:HEPN domain-containing protein [Actinotalea fermentans]KGM17667.1 hypothetical protein N867_16900 [Actinotalea fermentans ATCC 43279 = JCM 9966 = DSM 3133]GEN79884.1 hypothetical protein AFE02nite_16180 [Actinotalea fermentans]